MEDKMDSETSMHDIFSIATYLGVKAPEILLPSAEIERGLWSVIACDQYTSQPNYWDDIERKVGNSPSTLHIVLPELYLEHPGSKSTSERINEINLNMENYLSEGILMSIGECMILVDRQTPLANSRLGLVMAIDLEKYDYDPEKKNLIRATEGTVLDRIPPRLKIRKDALLESPHVQLLVDDPDFSIHAPLYNQCNEGLFEMVYDIELMAGGGHVKGYRIPKDNDAISQIINALNSLASLKNEGLLFAVGDGNHSLATAKAHWDSIKSNVSSEHPARYALVEIINIHDDGLKFEPIHRVLFNVDFDDFILKSHSILPDSGVMISEKMSIDNAVLMAQTIDSEVQPIPIFRGKEAVVFTFTNPPSNLAAGSMQMLIDIYLSDTGGKVDYIHGEETVFELSSENIGMLFPPVSKESFFEMISKERVLPRKTFSMGEAFEKRYYLECKLIVS